MTAKCTSWRGHRFAARYSTKPATLSARALQELWWMAGDDRERLTQPVKTYECDVCVRCGHVVQKDGK